MTPKPQAKKTTHEMGQWTSYGKISYGSIDWKILEILKRNHSAKDCPQRGTCLNERQSLEAIQALITEAVQNYQTEFEQKHIASAVKLARANERQAMLDIPDLQDESVTHAANSAQFNSISGQNMLRVKIRTAIKKMGGSDD